MICDMPNAEALERKGEVTESVLIEGGHRGPFCPIAARGLPSFRALTTERYRLAFTASAPGQSSYIQPHHTEPRGD